MTTNIDRRNTIRSYYSGGTILGAMGALYNDLADGVIQEVFVDHMYAEHTNFDGWTIALVYKDKVARND